MGKELQAVLAGFGGQGVLFAGKVMANAGLIEDRELSWLPSYGPEMRGGTANCSVTLSDEPIGSPLVTSPTGLIAMNQPSYDKFIQEVAPGAVVVADSDLISDIEPVEGVDITAIPASKVEQVNGQVLGQDALLRPRDARRRHRQERACLQGCPHRQEQASNPDWNRCLTWNETNSNQWRSSASASGGCARHAT